MGILRKITLFTAFVAIGAALIAFTAERAYAGTYDISKDNVIINYTSDTQKVSGRDADNNNHLTEPDNEPVIIGTTTSYGIRITVASGCTARVKLSGVNIDTSTSSDKTVGIYGDGNAIIEISGNNILKSGDNYAGIEKNDSESSGSLEICGTGSLIATGGQYGAGIGGGNNKAGSNITISGGTVSANGGMFAAGIGGGYGAGYGGGTGSNITITGGTVTATGGAAGAGIGGGCYGNGSGITITGGTITANGYAGAGIGGGSDGDGSNITITGGTVTATGWQYGAGIGGGLRGAGSDIEITGGTVIAAGERAAAGIGGGYNGTGSVIRVSNDAKVMAAGGISNNDPSGYGAGAAIGNGGQANNVPGAEIEPDISGLYDTGFIKYYTAGTNSEDMKNETVSPSNIITLLKTITFDPNGGTCDTKTAKTVSSNNGSQVLASLPDATREDYTFDGWYTAREGGDKITTDYDFKSNTTVYAHWTLIPPDPETYTITFDANGGTVSPTSGTTGTDGKLASLPTPTLEGNTFTGWFTKKDGGTEVTTSTVFSSNETIYAHWKKDEPTPGPEPNPDPTPSPAPNPAMDNLHSEITSVTKGDYRITYAGRIPFPGKSKVTVKNFGDTFSVSQGDASYTVTKIKVNKKKKLIQITGLENADKKIVKEVKKATKGGDGLSFDYTPYYVKDTDKVDPKFKKDELKSVKILINGKLYKAKNTEYEYDKEKKVITFKAPNLGGSYRVP